MKMKNIKIAFVPFSVRCPQHANTGSIRIRVKWPMKYIKDSFMALDPRDAELADVVILQKVYGPMINHKVRYLKEIGKKIIFDICDPDWLMPTQTASLDEMLEMADCITVPTCQMAELVRERTKTPIEIIPDGMCLEYHNKFKTDHGSNVPPEIVWFGNRGTIKALKKYIPELEEIYDKFNFKLKIISDSGEIETKIPWEFTEWKLDTVNDEIMACDIAINPKLDEIWDYPKSNNKTLTAWACGLPCVEIWPGRIGFSTWKNYLLTLLEDPEMRENLGRLGRKDVEEKHDVQLSAKKMEGLCKKLTQKNAKINYHNH